MVDILLIVDTLLRVLIDAVLPNIVLNLISRAAKFCPTDISLLTFISDVEILSSFGALI